MKIRTVDVEVLREGPRHNQLLSPLTHYIAICGDSPASRLVLPANYEQASFDRRLAELRYEVVSDDPARLRGVLRETGTEIGRILGGIPGLAGSLLVDRDRNSTLVHLRLVLSASELARIPFELSMVPAGGGASPDEWLVLHRPICLTRRDRAIASSTCSWSTAPRILLVVGPDVDDAFADHLAALNEVLRPWSGCPTRRGPSRNSPPWLTILTGEAASLDGIEQAMKVRPTHVHILAHGEEDFDDHHGRFGVALHGGAVTGDRLASALTTIDDDRAHLPTVVTLATCDSAHEAAPVAPDPSVAHALHSRGVPLVIASQFPLSVDGSVPFVKVLYGDLLNGRHPLESVYRLRLALHSAQSDFYHDWGAITVYEALPDDLDDQLDELRYWQSRRAHDSALRRVEWLCPPRSDEGAAETPTWVPPDDDMYTPLTQAVEDSAARLPTSGPYAIEAIGLRAAGWKRLAEVDFWLAGASDEEARRERLYDRSARRLRQSLEEYERAVGALLGSGGEVVNKKVSLHWMLTQVLSTTLLFEPRRPPRASDEDGVADAAFGDLQASLWTTSKLSAEVDRTTRLDGDRAWGHVSLTELWLLRLADGALDDAGRSRASERALENAEQIVALMGKAAEQTLNTRRHIERYVRWWGAPEFNDHMSKHGVRVGDAWGPGGALRSTAQAVIDVLSGNDWTPDPHPDCLDEPDAGTDAPDGFGTATDG